MDRIRFSEVLKKHLSHTPGLQIVGLVIVANAGLLLLSVASWWSILSTLIAIFAYIALQHMESNIEADHLPIPKPEEQTPVVQAEETQPTDPPIAKAVGVTKILLITNDELDHHRIKLWLAGWAIKYTHCRNTVQAFSELLIGINENAPYDLILTDQSGMDIDPLQLVTSLKAEETVNSVQLVHIGPKGNPLADAALLGAGYSTVLHFPLDKRALFSQINRNKMAEVNHADIPRISDQFAISQTLPTQDILVAESRHSDQFRLKHILQQLGHRVYAVKNGEEALEALDTHHFDLAILSSDLKGIDGLTVIKLYRHSRMSQAWVPLVALLDPENQDHCHQCNEADISLRLDRPVTSKTISNLIHQVLIENSHSPTSTDGHTLSSYHNDHLEPHSVDIDRLDELNQLNKNPQFLIKLIKKFETESLEVLTGLKRAQKREDLADIRMLGHRLKDSAGSLGALGLYRQGVLVSRLSDHDLTETTGFLISNIEKCRETTMKFLLAHTHAGSAVQIDKD